MFTCWIDSKIFYILTLLGYGWRYVHQLPTLWKSRGVYRHCIRLHVDRLRRIRLDRPCFGERAGACGPPANGSAQRQWSDLQRQRWPHVSTLLPSRVLIDSHNGGKSCEVWMICFFMFMPYCTKPICCFLNSVYLVVNTVQNVYKLF